MHQDLQAASRASKQPLLTWRPQQVAEDDMFEIMVSVQDEPKAQKVREILLGDRPYKSRSVPRLDRVGRPALPLTQIIPRPLLSSYLLPATTGDRQL